ncbi:MAG TPA: PIG-L family deacetylase [Spongiibacteraceae bacterium]|nr:PIG-L family deacetylase [Spongiibacteraceae bacterium]
MRHHSLTVLAPVTLGCLLALHASLSSAAGLLVVAPHPDDDLLIAAGVIANAKARGDQVKVVFVTNGDFNGETSGLLREGEAVNAQLYLGTSEDDLIFLGYPDGGLTTMANGYPNATDAYWGPNNRSTTYGDHGLGHADYHTYQFGVPALYNRANVVADLQSIIETYLPDHIITTAEYDRHPDHSITFELVKNAIDGAVAAHAGYDPSLHKALVWADYIGENPAWPNLIDPTAYLSEPPNMASEENWSARQSIDVPVAMQTTSFSVNPKYLSIDAHISQGGANSFLGRFIHADEVFWLESLSGTTLPPQAEAGVNQSAAAGASAQLNGLASSDPNSGALTYSWRQTDGPPVTVTGANTATPSFQAPADLLNDTALGFELVVNNGTKNSLPDLVWVNTHAAGESVENIAPYATAHASSENGADGQLAQSAIDGVADGYPGDFTKEWAAIGEGVGAWLELQWPVPVDINHVVLFDRPNSSDFILGGVLTFSDGSSVNVPPLHNDGGALEIGFTRRTVTSMRFTATAVSASTENVGLAEIQVYGFGASFRNGDINGDGKVNVADLLLLRQYLNGSKTLTTTQITRGDLYPAAGDGQLTVSDALLLEKLLIGN